MCICIIFFYFVDEIENACPVWTTFVNRFDTYDQVNNLAKIGIYYKLYRKNMLGKQYTSMQWRITCKYQGGFNVKD